MMTEGHRQTKKIPEIINLLSYCCQPYRRSVLHEKKLIKNCVINGNEIVCGEK
jgi:hypothetical protein